VDFMVYSNIIHADDCARIGHYLNLFRSNLEINFPKSNSKKSTAKSPDDISTPPDDVPTPLTHPTPLQTPHLQEREGISPGVGGSLARNISIFESDGYGLTMMYSNKATLSLALVGTAEGLKGRLNN
jgi:hypothetical protein